MENHEEKQVAEELVRRTAVEDTPFTIIEEKDKETLIVIGDTLLAKIEGGLSEAQDYIDSKPWSLILLAGTVVANKINAYHKAKEKEQLFHVEQ